MTATSLFDLLARSAASGNQRSAQLARFADRLVASVLTDLDRLRADEQAILSARAGEEDDGLDLEVVRSLWDLYAHWSQDAEQVIARVRPLVSDADTTRQLDRLEDAYGSVKARLSVRPEAVVQGREQVRQGAGISARELRDELRTRLRA